jgi:hypothetical protein
MKKLLILTLFISQSFAVKAQSRVFAAGGFHTNNAALGLDIQLPNSPFHGRAMAASFPSNIQKYTAGPTIDLYVFPNTKSTIFTAQNLSLDITPWNWDWGTYHSLGIEHKVHNFYFFTEAALLWDVEPGFTGPKYFGGAVGIGYNLL